MAQLAKLEAAVAMKNPNKLMDFLKNNIQALPQLFPQLYKSVEIVGGGRQLATGSIISLSYYLPGTPTLMRGSVEVESMDEARKSIALNVIGGDGLKMFKSFRVKCEIDDEQPQLVKWSLEYDKASPSTPPADPYLEFYINLTAAIDVL
ncbi:unnamed protein product [Linum tenue]|uniref:Bet v I/Major latex protein domain-containing protein n=1 Tax=Linum tenue TaxID=586396 RepID=A0AAV0QJW6_9ROSI|nr:unnamed protein product [Linum tenue]